MKRNAVKIVGIAVLGAALSVSSIAFLVAAEKGKEKEKAADKAQAPAAAANPAPPAAAEKVAYSFADQSKVDAFAKLWQQRQATVLRMTVLRSYFQEEQAALEQLNQQFAKDYNLDVAKNYRFDSEKKVIIELAEPAAQAVTSPIAASVGAAVQ